MTGGPVIDYEALTQEAMRGVVRSVLARVAKSGLPGEHHFYIAFDTRAAGVTLSRRLKEKYPDEMTIVLQHRFWDLMVADDRFEVKLTFDGIPERLVIPFTAIKVFFDPSVRYTLQFEDLSAIEEPQEPSLGRRRDTGARRGPSVGGESGERAGPRAVVERRQRTRPKPRSDKAGEIEPASERLPMLVKDQEEAKPAPGSDPAAQPAKSGAQVVSLDAFRKK
ncbi:MAG TPA: ClpXP protease specificity-enhancing factor SspB [Hyphomicrobiaceae bacterium]|nr:ClpXP protease specificity-enhancing factor SspB [Hyphomicrobiaceae bacterium]